MPFYLCCNLKFYNLRVGKGRSRGPGRVPYLLSTLRRQEQNLAEFNLKEHCLYGTLVCGLGVSVAYRYLDPPIKKIC